MAKIITQKSQIPKSAQKKIKNFSKLTNNQAIYQYELNKLVKRAKGDYGQFLKGYYQMPSRVTKRAIEEIRSLRNVRLRYSREKYETERRIDRITRDRIEYEAPRIEQPVVENPANDYDWYDYSDYYEPSDAIDINDLIEKEKQYDSVKDYLEETGQAIDPFTGEVITEEASQQIIQSVTDVSGSEDLRPTINSVEEVSEFESAKDLIDNIRQYVLQEIDRAIVSNSTYKSGRQRTSRSREWITTNINKAGDMILKELDRISSSESELKRFATKFSDSALLQQLYDAINEYLTTSDSFYNAPDVDYFNSSEIYSLLHDGPMTLADSKGFEDEE